MLFVLFWFGQGQCW